MKSGIARSLVALCFLSLAGLQVKAETDVVRSATPWYPITFCNDGNFAVQFRDLVPTGHRSSATVITEYRMFLGGDVAKAAGQADSRIQRLVDSGGGTLAVTLHAYNENATVNLCESENCSQGPNFVIPQPSGTAIRQLSFTIATIGSHGQVGQKVELDCSHSPDLSGRSH